MNLRSSDKAANTGEQGAEVFVVDDEPMVLELAAILLKGAGHTVSCFRDPAAALDAFSAAAVKPRLIITDYAMPAMNGLELMRACRKVRPEQKVLMVSGTIDERFLVSHAELPDCFMSKPFRNEEFVGVVRQLLLDAQHPGQPPS